MKTQVIAKADQMLVFADSIRSRNQTIGFVPTMGALHEGHASLIRKAKEECDSVIVSVFVNPTQFNEKSDLDKYPRTFDEDKELLEKLNVDIMFHPSAEEMYPVGEVANYNLDGLDNLMEGPNRPGHFNGVVQVVMRLFDITKPTKAFFGEKDFQQLAIIKHMTKKLGYDVKVIGCPTVREESGLAMSSRNTRLSDNGLNQAATISNSLIKLREDVSSCGMKKALENAISELNDIVGLELEYYELVEPETLVRATDDSTSIQACVAAWVEDVRLIDNLKVK